LAHIYTSAVTAD